jgi:hypothetical protein
MRLGQDSLHQYVQITQLMFWEIKKPIDGWSELLKRHYILSSSA